jgi:predicted extracellular nuclease
VSNARLMPMQRSFTLLLTLAMALGLLVPLVAPTSTRAAPTELFFSEYVEGSSNNKALEIFNGTGMAVDLAAGGYQIDVYFNAAPTAGLTIPLTGTVATGDVHVVANSLATAAILAVADQISVASWFNGDDAVVLRTGTTIIDVIGQLVFDPGDFWGSGDLTTQDHTLRRKGTIQAGDSNGADAFDPATEWDGFAINTFDGLGSHALAGDPTNPTGVGAATPASVPVGGSVLLTVAVTPGANPTSSGLTVTADLGPIGGGAAQAFSDDATGGDVTAGDLIFSFSAIVGPVGSGSKVITATIGDAQARSGTASIGLVVEGAPTAIWEIQGAGHLSSYDGLQVFDVEGIVTATRTGSSGGFWMTDPTPDADPATSDGVFVFRPNSAADPLPVAVGDLASVDGTVDEFRSGGSGGFENLTTTEIVTPTITILSTGNTLPFTLIGAGGRLPPATVIDDDTLPSGGGGDGTIDGVGAVTSFDPASDGIDFWESLEGMRLQVTEAVAVGPTAFFGAVSREIAVVSGSAPGVRTPRGGILVRGLGPAGDYRPGDFNPERLILANTLAGLPEVNVGDGFETDPVGVLDYSFGNFKLFVTANPGRVNHGLLREVTDETGSRELAVATYNVENLTVGNAQAKFDELAGQIVHNLRSPDLIGIEEMQDDSGATNNGIVTAQLGWERLVAAIVSAGGPVYEFRSIDPVNNADGGAPGSNIRVGFLFRTDRGLEFVDRPGGSATADTDAVATPNGKGAQLTVSPGRVLPDTDGALANAFFDTRKSLAGEFRWRGETLFVVVNHFSSKGDDHPLLGRFQPPVRWTEFASGSPEDGWRHAQAQVINDFVDEITAVDDGAHVIVLGDINDFDFSETVAILSGERVAGVGGPDLDGSGPTASGGDAVLGTLFDTLPANERYSYVFEGNSQVLDQILVSGSLLDLDPRYDVVHVNAEFAAQASDHDPSIMRVSFQPRRGD